jgi:hypothetical protein
MGFMADRGREHEMEESEGLRCFSPLIEAWTKKVPLMELHVDYIEHLMITRGEDEVGRARSWMVLGVWEKKKEWVTDFYLPLSLPCH